jgi:hypothetical protein
MLIEKTIRGFELIQFKDRYGHECSLQQSSLADFEPPGSSAIWFGVSDTDRMHIDLEQMKELIVYLQNWIATGSFGSHE